MQNPKSIVDWSVEDTSKWLDKEGFDKEIIQNLCEVNRINGKCLLALNEVDFTQEPLNKLPLRDRKCLYISCKTLQRENQSLLLDLGLLEPSTSSYYSHNHCHKNDYSDYFESERISPPISEDGKTQRLKPEKTKTLIAFLYLVSVTWITAFVMVIVHERVPDMQKYPPLPDIFLDNVPHIPWAFDMCEVTGTFLFTMWIFVLFFHKHRFILMRRFFALSGTVFLLRCVTMLITSLSVPGAHLQCKPPPINSQDLASKLSRAYYIWCGAGMSIQGVRTCGDYMFSGHTVALTMLNFFITEYTPRPIYYVHTISWMLNMFGIFFILAAHEHYSIDVFVAFYITSRLFLYYHTLSNNQALMQRDSNRTKIWFPLFSYFESGVEGIVPNEYETVGEICTNLWIFLKEIGKNFHHKIMPVKESANRITNVNSHPLAQRIASESGSNRSSRSASPASNHGPAPTPGHGLEDRSNSNSPEYGKAQSERSRSVSVESNKSGASGSQRSQSPLSQGSHSPASQRSNSPAGSGDYRKSRSRSIQSNRSGSPKSQTAGSNRSGSGSNRSRSNSGASNRSGSILSKDASQASRAGSQESKRSHSGQSRRSGSVASNRSGSQASNRSGSQASNKSDRQSRSGSRSSYKSGRSRSGSIRSNKSVPRSRSGSLNSNRSTWGSRSASQTSNRSGGRSRSASAGSKDSRRSGSQASNRSRSGSRRSRSGSSVSKKSNRPRSGSRSAASSRSGSADSRKSGNSIKSKSRSRSGSKSDRSRSTTPNLEIDEGPAEKKKVSDDEENEGNVSGQKKLRVIDSDSETEAGKEVSAAAIFGDDADDISSEEEKEKQPSDKEDRSPKSDDDDEQKSDTEQNKEEGDVEKENEPEPIPETRIDVEIPKISCDLGRDIHFVKLPNFLSVETRPFDPETYEDEIDEEETLDEEGRARLKLKVENTVRWREVMDEDGNIKKESNARIVRWSDGSYSLHLGSEIFDVYKQPLQGDHNHLFIRQGTGLQGQAVFRTKLSFRPHSTESFTHRKMTLSLADRSQKTSGIKILSQVGVDPDQDRYTRLKKEEEKLRQSARASKPRAKKENTRSLNSSRGEEDGSDDEGAISLNAIKNKYKQGGPSAKAAAATIYSSDEDGSDIEMKSKKQGKVLNIEESDEDSD